MDDAAAWARRAAERAARLSYGKLVAILAARTRDVAAAEDALADAFHAALRVWPARGVPDNPEAWLVSAARRGLGHVHRHSRVREAAQATLERLTETMDDPMGAGVISEGRPAIDIPDERLKLMFICAHPAIDRGSQAPLMLQTVLGLDAARIAACFLTSPAAMSQRLVRAKAKIRDAGIAFALPDTDQLTLRLDAVLSAIYAAFGAGWEDLAGSDQRCKGLSEEAIWLARVVVVLMPGSAEAQGLLALMLHCEARRAARRDALGRFVPLSQQDCALWDAAMTAEAERILADAGARGAPGRFQIEAAIQSVHAARARHGVTHWPALTALYDYLVQWSPTLGVMVSRAAVALEAGDPHRALRLLDELDNDAAGYQPFWAVRAHALLATGRAIEAGDALYRAAGLSDDPAVRTYLLGLLPRQ